mmetsp:Transcript_9381/g.16044  ORF Transcript_9381/g.16044 Transcript_9381/m.16044 type:complete len:297 (+) Transcript_9381:105-995(+)
MSKPQQNRNELMSVKFARNAKAKLPMSLVVIFLMLFLLRSSEQNIQIFNDNAVVAVAEKVVESKDDIEGESESCLRPRRNSNAAVKSPLKPPFINLGMPKMGSTSLHSYFDCGGYKSVHWKCGKRYCGECIEDAIQAGSSPLSTSKCTKNFGSYAQIDRGPEHLVQVNYLNEIVRGVPNATFILTFRNMTNWYKSMSNFNNLRQRFEAANITGLPRGVGRNVSEFSHFYCEYVKRVREEVAKYPGRHELIEIDIEDPTVGWQMEEAFGTSHTCWGKKNTAKHNDTVISVEELQRRD